MRFGGQVNYIQLNRAFGAYAQGNEQLGANINKGLDNLITGTLTNFQVAVDPHGAFPCPADPTHPIVDRSRAPHRHPVMSGLVADEFAELLPQRSLS